MKKIKRISLLCDNLVDIELTPADLSFIEIGDISSKISMAVDEFNMIHTCGYVVMVVNREANRLMDSPFGEYGSLFNLIHQDHCVTSICLHGEQETILYVPWSGDDTNDLMTTRITPDGSLMLVISKDDTVDSISGWHM